MRDTTQLILTSNPQPAYVILRNCPAPLFVRTPAYLGPKSKLCISYVIIMSQFSLLPTLRDVSMGVWGATRNPIFSKFQESCSKVSHTARKTVIIFSVTLLFSNTSWSNSQNAPPPQWKVLQHISSHTETTNVLLFLTMCQQQKKSTFFLKHKFPLCILPLLE